MAHPSAQARRGEQTVRCGVGCSVQRASHAAGDMVRLLKRKPWAESAWVDLLPQAGSPEDPARPAVPLLLPQAGTGEEDVVSEIRHGCPPIATGREAAQLISWCRTRKEVQLKTDRDS